MGDLEWRGKRDKKKKGSKKNSSQPSTPKDPNELLKRRLLDKERKEKRAEMFNLPRLKSGRKTRLQIHLVKEERNKKRKETLEKKKIVAAVAKKSRQQNSAVQNQPGKVNIPKKSQ